MGACYKWMGQSRREDDEGGGWGFNGRGMKGLKKQGYSVDVYLQ